MAILFNSHPYISSQSTYVNNQRTWHGYRRGRAVVAPRMRASVTAIVFRGRSWSVNGALCVRSVFSGSVTPWQPFIMGFSLAERRSLFYQQARPVLTLAEPSGRTVFTWLLSTEQLSFQHSYIYIYIYIYIYTERGGERERERREENMPLETAS